MKIYKILPFVFLSIFSKITAQNTFPATGNVGIGTSSPNHKLHVAGNFQFDGYLYGYQGRLIGGSDTGGAYFGGGGGTTSTFPTYIMAENAPIRFHNNSIERMRITETGNVGIGTSTPYLAYRTTLESNNGQVGNGLLLRGSGQTLGLGISAIAPTDNDNYEFWNYRNGYLRFATNNTERVRITSNGNIGIGTSLPASIGTGFTSVDISGINGGGIVMGTASQKTYFYSNSSSSIFLETPTNIKFSSNGTTNFFMNSTGVGIGTTSPTEKLQVNGNVLIGGSSVTSAKFSLNRANAGANSNYSVLLSSPNSPTIQVGYGMDYTGERSGITAVNSPFYQWAIPAANSMQFGRINKVAGSSFNSSDEQPLLTLGSTGNTTHVPLQYRFDSERNVYNNVYFYSGNSGTALTGAFVIETPFLANVMSKITIKGYDYSSKGDWELNISGYTYTQPSSSWINYKGEIVGNAPFKLVRLGYNTTNNKYVIILGDATDTWNYPKIYINEVMTSFTSNPTDNYANGWSGSFATSLTNYGDLRILNTQKYFVGYGSGNYSGTATKLLGVTTSGNVIESELPTASNNSWSGSNSFLNEFVLRDNTKARTDVGYTKYISFRDNSNLEIGWQGYGSAYNNNYHFYNGFGGYRFWTGGEERLSVIDNGNVGIGTTSPRTKLDISGNVAIGMPTDKAYPSNYKLAIGGNALAEKMVVKLQTNWPDYVFHSDYTLPPLSQVEEHIKTKGHLPNIPTEKEVKETGIDLGDMNAKLLQKIEELTLYLIENERKVQLLQEEIKKLKSK